MQPNKGAANATESLKLTTKPEQSLAVETNTNVPTSLAPSPIGCALYCSFTSICLYGFGGTIIIQILW